MKYPTREPRHPIQVVARRTGLTPDVIRAWERRYGVVEPRRTAASRRLFSDSDVEKLRLLRRAVLAGRRISDVAGLSPRELEALVDADSNLGDETLDPPSPPGDGPSPNRFLRSSLRAVEELDAQRLQRELEAAALHLGTPELLEGVVAPLMHRVGQRWREGTLRIAHEHLATTLVRSMLGKLRAARSHPLPGPDLVVATLAGQVHELGAVMVATAAAASGWRATFLGPDLPAEEIAGAARRCGAAAVALSLIHPTDDPLLADGLRRLSTSLPGEVELFAGGAAAEAHRGLLDELGAIYLDGITALLQELDRLRERFI